MRVALSVDGGMASFPGLRERAVLDVDALPEKERVAFAATVDRARFFTCAEHPAVPGLADLRTYTLEIDDGRRRRTLRLHEPIMDPALNALLQAVKAHAMALRNASERH